jgi:purine-binding chemotaxis protein CheW
MTRANEAEQILRTRARALARTPPQASAEGAMLELLEFRLASERYAVESQLVEEVHPLRDLTPLPCTPPFVLGIVNVRGRILPVLDLKKFFDLPERGLTDLHRIILVRGNDLPAGDSLVPAGGSLVPAGGSLAPAGGSLAPAGGSLAGRSVAGRSVAGRSVAGRSVIELGLLADVIVGVRSVATDSLQPSLPTLTGIRADFLMGVTDERLVVLDLGRILLDPKIIVHEEVEA